MTRIAYLDCPSGVSGDMVLGALLDAGVELDQLRALLSTLPLEGYTLTAVPVTRGALGATYARVELAREEQAHRHLGDVLAIIEAGALPHKVKQDARAVFRWLAEAEARVHRIGVEEVHFHEVGAVDAIVDIVGACAGLYLLGIDELYCSPLPLGRGQATMAHGCLPLPAPAVLELLSAAGAPTVPHEATTELVTPTGAAFVTTLARFAQPPLRLARVGYGAGTRTEPAPNLLRLWLGDREEHLVAAHREEHLVAAHREEQPVAAHDEREPRRRHWYPARRHDGQEHTIRRPTPLLAEGGGLAAGDAQSETQAAGDRDSAALREREPSGRHRLRARRPRSRAVPPRIMGLKIERLLVLEANIDDMPAEHFGYAVERLLASGALDAWCTPLTMKKSRPATMLSALCRPLDRIALLDVFLRETSTFGVREREVTRYAAAREVRTVETPYGHVQVKLKLLDGTVAGAAPEYDDCHRLAAERNVPLHQVYAAAVAAAASMLGS